MCLVALVRTKDEPVVCAHRYSPLRQRRMCAILIQKHTHTHSARTETNPYPKNTQLLRGIAVLLTGEEPFLRVTEAQHTQGLQLSYTHTYTHTRRPLKRKRNFFSQPGSSTHARCSRCCANLRIVLRRGQSCVETRQDAAFAILG